MTLFITILVSTFFIALALAISFGVVSAIFYGICWAFGIVFTWKIAVGIWLTFLLLRAVFRVVIKEN